MNRQIKRRLLWACALMLLFLALTLAVMRVDVRPIGPEGSAVGLATINEFVWGLFGERLVWYHITDWLGVLAILTAFGFAVTGLLQLIKRQSPRRVDEDLYALGGLYALVFAAYVFFETHVVNFRPILMDGRLEASFPSSHTMIVTCIMAAAMLAFRRMLKRKAVLYAADAACALIIAVTVIGRLLSGVHWFTDIIAALLLASSLTLLYDAALLWIDEKAAGARNVS